MELPTLAPPENQTVRVLEYLQVEFHGLRRALSDFDKNTCLAHLHTIREELALLPSRSPCRKPLLGLVEHLEGIRLEKLRMPSLYMSEALEGHALVWIELKWVVTEEKDEDLFRFVDWLKGNRRRPLLEPVVKKKKEGEMRGRSRKPSSPSPSTSS